MNRFLIAVIVLFSSAFARAECFYFVNERGPTSLAQVDFNGYKAESFCLREVHGFNHNYTSLILSDKEGDLIQVAVKKSVGRCGPEQTCLALDGLSGNANGENLTDTQATSIRVVVNTQFKDNIGISLGTFKDELNQKSYLISEKK